MFFRTHHSMNGKKKNKLGGGNTVCYYFIEAC